MHVFHWTIASITLAHAFPDPTHPWSRRRIGRDGSTRFKSGAVALADAAAFYYRTGLELADFPHDLTRPQVQLVLHLSWDYQIPQGLLRAIWNRGPTSINVIYEDYDVTENTRRVLRYFVASENTVESLSTPILRCFLVAVKARTEWRVLQYLLSMYRDATVQYMVGINDANMYDEQLRQVREYKVPEREPPRWWLDSSYGALWDDASDFRDFVKKRLTNMEPQHWLMSS